MGRTTFSFLYERFYVSSFLILQVAGERCWLIVCLVIVMMPICFRKRLKKFRNDRQDLVFSCPSEMHFELLAFRLRRPLFQPGSEDQGRWVAPKMLLVDVYQVTTATTRPKGSVAGRCR